MATPLTAQWRVTIPYLVQGRNHKVRFYVNDATVGGTTYQIPDRTAVLMNWETGVDSFIVSLGNIMSSGDTVGTCLLEQLVSGIWQLRATHTPGTFTVTGSYVPSSQATLVLRDTNFKKLKVVILDTGVQPPEHAVTVSGCDSQSQFFVTEFTSAGAGAQPPYKWVVSRSKAYIDPAGFVGYTVALNRKIRRARGLA